MTLHNITLSFQMTVSSVDIDKNFNIITARKEIKRVAFNQFVNQAEPFDSIHIIDCPEYPALLD